MSRAALAFALAACHGASEPPAAPPLRPRPVDAAPPRPDAARHDAGTLAAPKDPAKVWPSRVCVDGRALVFENDCGCNDALLCTITGTGPGGGDALAVTLTTDPSRMPQCTDCFPMIPARCAIPAAHAWHVVINGEPAFELPADALDTIDGACWNLAR